MGISFESQILSNPSPPIIHLAFFASIALDIATQDRDFNAMLFHLPKLEILGAIFAQPILLLVSARIILHANTAVHQALAPRMPDLHNLLFQLAPHNATRQRGEDILLVRRD